MSKKNQNHKIILSWKEKDSTPLENLIVSTDESWFKAKHPARMKEEINFIASLRPDGYPYCGEECFVPKSIYDEKSSPQGRSPYKRNDR